MLGDVPVTEVDTARNASDPSEALAPAHWTLIGTLSSRHIVTIP